MNTSSPALKPVMDLEVILQELLVEHHKLIKHLEAQQSAMQMLAIKEMESARSLQEYSRSRIVGLEQRRRTQTLQIARINQLHAEPKLQQIAEMYPARRGQLLKFNVELRAVIKEIQSKSFIVNKLASAVLGHLNTAMRILSGAVGGGGVYTQRGVAKVSNRIGVMEAVG